MTWPVACIIIALILAFTGIVRAAIWAAAEARSDEVANELDEVANELDQVWNAIETTVRDVERITPIEMSLLDH